MIVIGEVADWDFCMQIPERKRYYKSEPRILGWTKRLGNL